MQYRVEDSFREWAEPLCEAFLSCSDNSDLLLRFLRDLWTPDEAEKFSQRWRVAQQLLDGVPPGVVAKNLDISPGFVKAVSKFAVAPFQTGGYKEVYQRVQEKHPHSK
jgi:uncharacterized protein YerC